MKSSLNERTVHVKGCPSETTLDELFQWSQECGSVESIQMRRKPKKKVFKGCVFITYSSKSMADKIINESVLKFCGSTDPHIIKTIDRLVITKQNQFTFYILMELANKEEHYLTNWINSDH